MHTNDTQEPIELVEERARNKRLKRLLEFVKLQEENKRLEEEIDRITNPYKYPDPYTPWDGTSRIVYCSNTN